MKKLSQYKSILIMLVIAAIVAALFLTETVTVEQLVSAAEHNTALTVLVIVGLSVLKGVSLCIPFVALTVATSQVFAPLPAVIINFFCTALCITVSYCIGRFSKKISLEDTFRKYPKVSRYFRNAERNGFAFCFAVHAMHLSMEAQGVLFGITRTKYTDYLFSSMLALLPSMLYFTIIGSDWDLTNPLFWWFIGLDVIVVLVGLYLFRTKIFKKE